MNGAIPFLIWLGLPVAVPASSPAAEVAPVRMPELRALITELEQLHDAKYPFAKEHFKELARLESKTESDSGVTKELARLTVNRSCK